MIGCSYWTSILHGDITMLKSALLHVSRLKNFYFDPDAPAASRRAVTFLIDILIREYAPKPLYEGWASLNIPDINDGETADMTSGCVVLNPGTWCIFYRQKIFAQGRP